MVGLFGHTLHLTALIIHRFHRLGSRHPHSPKPQREPISPGFSPKEPGHFFGRRAGWMNNSQRRVQPALRRRVQDGCIPETETANGNRRSRRPGGGWRLNAPAALREAGAFLPSPMPGVADADAIHHASELVSRAKLLHTAGLCSARPRADLDRECPHADPAAARDVA